MVSSAARTVDEYLASLPADRRAAMETVRDVVLRHLPNGYEETMQYGMICYSVPLSRYPDTYNGQPLGIAGLASQKGYMSLYLLGVYGDPALRRWFEAEYRKSGKKLDMGKSCVRFRSIDELPLDVIGKVIGALGVDEFIARVEATLSGRKGGASAKQQPRAAKTTSRSSQPSRSKSKRAAKPATKPAAKRRAK